MTFDLNSILMLVINGVLGVIGSVFLYWLKEHMKDQQAAQVIGAAVENATGAVQQAAQAGVAAWHPRLTIPGVSPQLAVGVQYVLDHAGPELERYTGITPAAIADKIAAKIGLANIATNIATAASPSPSPAPLDPVPAPAPSGAAP